MTPENAVRWYKAKKFVKKAAKVVSTQVADPGGLAGFANPVTLSANAVSIHKSHEHAQEIGRILTRLQAYKKANHRISDSLIEAIAYAKSQKESKQKRKAVGVVPVVSTVTTVYSAHHAVTKRSQGRTRRRHARELWEKAKRGIEPEMDAACAVIVELVGQKKFSWVLQTAAGWQTVIYDKLAKT